LQARIHNKNKKVQEQHSLRNWTCDKEEQKRKLQKMFSPKDLEEAITKFKESK
jgi:hypothetical protein